MIKAYDIELDATKGTCRLALANEIREILSRNFPEAEKLSDPIALSLFFSMEGKRNEIAARAGYFQGEI